MNSGEIAEYLFAYRCASFGWEVAKPLSNCLPYDFIINRGDKWERVQVKKPFYTNGYKIAKIYISRNHKDKLYNIDDFDILAAVDDDTFLMIPWIDLYEKGITHRINVDSPKYAKYRIDFRDHAENVTACPILS